MKDSLTSLNREDFRQRYRGSFGFLHTETQDRRLVYIQEVANNQVVFKTSSRGMDYYANCDAGVVFEFLPVQRSWYNLGDKPGLLFRVPARQYCRGISKSNTSFSVVHPEVAMLQPSTLTLEVLARVFSVDKFAHEPREVLLERFVNKESWFFVLSRAFCMAHGTLFFFADAVGKYAGTEITLNNPVIRQELLDAIKRNNLPFTVKVDH
jgi:hypothetical protein